MQIKLDIKIFAFLLLFILTKQVEIYILLMVFALLHEIGHMVARNTAWAETRKV